MTQTVLCSTLFLYIGHLRENVRASNSKTSEAGQCKRFPGLLNGKEMQEHEWAVVEPILDASMAKANGLDDKELMLMMNLSDNVLELEQASGAEQQEKSRVFIMIRSQPKCVTVEEKESSVKDGEAAVRSQAQAVQQQKPQKKTRQVCLVQVVYPRIPDLFGAVIHREDDTDKTPVGKQGKLGDGLKFLL